MTIPFRRRRGTDRKQLARADQNERPTGVSPTSAGDTAPGQSITGLRRSRAGTSRTEPPDGAYHSAGCRCRAMVGTCGEQGQPAARGTFPAIAGIAGNGGVLQLGTGVPGGSRGGGDAGGSRGTVGVPVLTTMDWYSA